jgi:VanZ family protein
MNKKQILYLILVILWFGLIISFSSQVAEDSAKLSGGITETVITVLKTVKLLPEGEVEEVTLELVHKMIRKAAHFFMYAVLAMFISLFLIYSNVNANKIIILALVISACLACVDELYQTTIPGRAGQISDVLLDSLGALSGSTILIIARKHLGIS